MRYISFIFILVSSVYAMTDEEYKVKMVKAVMRCTKEHPVEMTELLNLEKLIVPKEKDTKCLLACAYRKTGSMNAKGMFDKEHAIKAADLLANGDETRKKNALKVAEICSKVNDEAVSDGEVGCDRAALIFKCVTQTAAKYGFKF